MIGDHNVGRLQRADVVRIVAAQTVARADEQTQQQADDGSRPDAGTRLNYRYIVASLLLTMYRMRYTIQYMAKYTHDIIIIGAGAGGLTAAVGCAQLGLKTALIDKKRLGGDCLFYGCVPSKSLLKTATVYRHALDAERFGLPKLDLRPPDMAAVNARVQSVIESIAKNDSPERFERLGAEVIFGQTQFLSPHELRIDGERTLSAKHIILAVGSSPRVLPIPGVQECGYITNLDVFSLPRRPDRLIIVGAGPIGLEMGQAFNRLGAEVTIVDIAPQIMINDDPDMAAVVAERLVREGIRLELGIRVVRAEGADNRKRLIIERDGAEHVLEGDQLLLAAGRQGNTADLDLDKAGVTVERSFVPTDSKLRTSQRHIIAIGDCNGRMLFTHVAATEGSVAVRRLALRAGGTMSYRHVPWVTFTDPELASIGYNERMAKKDGIDYRVHTQDFEATDRALAEGEPEGRLKILLDRKERILGVQLVGLHAGDLLLPALFAVRGSWKLSQLRGPIVPYPTIGEVYPRAVGNYLAPKLFNNKVRAVLRFLHHYRGTAGEWRSS